MAPVALETINVKVVAGSELLERPIVESEVDRGNLSEQRRYLRRRVARTAAHEFGDSQVYILLTKGSGAEDWNRESTQYLVEKGIDIMKTEWKRDSCRYLFRGSCVRFKHQ